MNARVRSRLCIAHRPEPKQLPGPFLPTRAEAVGLVITYALLVFLMAVHTSLVFLMAVYTPLVLAPWKNVP
jgi:hypothetical protein